MTRKTCQKTAAAAGALKATSINLLAGWPNAKLLPPRYLRASADTVLANETLSTPALCYGPDDGYLPLREAIGNWLTDFYRPHRDITLDRICVTGGASQNLASVLQVFTDPIYTRNVWMVSPTYFLACRVFDDAGFAGKLRAVPEDEEGIDIAYLSRAIEASETDAVTAGNIAPTLKTPRPWRKIFKHIIYAVPTFSNPSGRLMSLARRQQLVRLARKHDALIITDDVYDMLQWRTYISSSLRHGSSSPLTRAILPRLVDVDASLDDGPSDSFGNTVSNGTFSKIVAPGCRTGWAEGSPKLVWGLSQAGQSRSGGCPSQFTSTLIHQLLTTNQLQSHITHTLIPSYSRRYHILLNAITKHLTPLGCKLISQPATIPHHHYHQSTDDEYATISANHLKHQGEDKFEVAGGYFLYLTLPHSLPASVITSKALEQENLIIIPGPRFRVEGDSTEEEGKYTSDVRLSFAWEEEELLEEGVKRLARVVSGELERKRKDLGE